MSFFFFHPIVRKTVFPRQKAKKEVKKLCVSLKSSIFAVGRLLLFFHLIIFLRSSVLFVINEI